MKSFFSAAMREATRLTRKHDPVAATRAIQRALAGDGGQTPSEDRKPPAATRLISVQADGAESAGAPEPRPDAGGSANVLKAALDLSAPLRPRKPLPEVLSLLRQADLPSLDSIPIPFGKSPTAPTVVVPVGAAYLSRSFTCAAGSRAYKVYVPSQKHAKAPLIVMLHGCTQTPDDFAVGTQMNQVAEEHGCVVAYPWQSTKANQMGCWNWFNPEDQARDSGEPRIIAGITRSIMAEFAIDPDRVYVAGLSAGGAMAAIMSETYPELYAATGIHSGLAYGCAKDMASAFAAMRGTSKPAARPPSKSRPDRAPDGVRTIVFHGVSDRTVHLCNAEMILAEVRGRLTGGAQATACDGIAGGSTYKRLVITDGSDAPQAELWTVTGLGHAWSGGSPDGTYTDQRGPDASREMLRFFLNGPTRPKAH